jgi:hypothetical protein
MGDVACDDDMTHSIRAAKVLGGKDGESFADFVKFGIDAYLVLRRV